MSTSIESQQDFARMVTNHPALEAVRERVQQALFKRFRGGSPEQREIINAIMDNESLFFHEIAVIFDESLVIEDGEDEDPNAAE